MANTNATSATAALIAQHRIKLVGRITRLERQLAETKEQLNHHDQLFQETPKK